MHSTSLGGRTKGHGRLLTSQNQVEPHTPVQHRQSRCPLTFCLVKSQLCPRASKGPVSRRSLRRRYFPREYVQANCVGTAIVLEFQRAARKEVEIPQLKD